MAPLERFADVPIIDCHTHAFGGNLEALRGLIALREAWNFQGVNILSLMALGATRLTDNLLCLAFKGFLPGKAYAFGGLSHPPAGTGGVDPDFRDQVERLMALGFDGLKLIEGKPTVRKLTGIALDSPLYDGMYSLLAERGFPVLFHVADPETFWNEQTVPGFARAEGWFYGDGTFPPYRRSYDEVFRVLEKHPRLSVIFAHFFFLSGCLDRAAEVLERWPGVSFDLTPGSEMYEAFSKAPEAWREFFIRYRKRILFGTDNDYGDALNVITNVRRFLESRDVFTGWGMTIRGLGLPPDVLADIYHGNFLRRVAGSPRGLDRQLMHEDLDRLASVAASESCPEKVRRQVAELRDLP
jgi:predicted TIM-barrel fold metal-dependent hydrolase